MQLNSSGRGDVSRSLVPLNDSTRSIAMSRYDDMQIRNSYSNNADALVISGERPEKSLVITRKVYENIIHREKLFEAALRARCEIQNELDAAACDVERMFALCQLEIEIIRKSAYVSAAENANLTTVSFEANDFDAAIDSLQRDIEKLAAQRDELAPPNEKSLLRSKISRLESSVAMINQVINECREKFESTVGAAFNRSREKDREIYALNKKIEEKDAEIAKLHREIKKIEEEGKKLRAQLGQARQDLESSKAHSHEYTSLATTEKRNLEQQLDSVVLREKETVRELTVSLERARDEYHASCIEIERLKSQSKLDERELRQLRESFSTLKTEHDTLRMQHNQLKASSESESRGSTLKIHDLENTVSTLSMRLKTVEESDADGKTKNEELFRYLSEYKHKIEELEVVKRDAETMAVQLRKQEGELKALNTLRDENGNLREKLAETRAQLEAATTQVAHLNSEKSSLDKDRIERVSELEGTIELLTTQLSTLQKADSAKEGQLAQLRSSATNQDKILQEKENMLTSLQVRCSELQSRNIELERKYSEYEREVQRHSSQSAEASETITKYRSENESFRLQLESKERLLEAAKAQANSDKLRTESLSKRLQDMDSLIADLNRKAEDATRNSSMSDDKVAELRALVPYWRLEALSDESWRKALKVRTREGDIQFKAKKELPNYFCLECQSKEVTSTTLNNTMTSPDMS